MIAGELDPTLIKQQAASAVRASGNNVYKIGRSSYAKVSVLNLTTDSINDIFCDGTEWRR